MSLLAQPTLALYAVAAAATAVSHGPAELAALGGCGGVLLARAALRRHATPQPVALAAASEIQRSGDGDARAVGQVQV